MDVRLEDGTVIKNVPPGTTKSQIMARLNKASTPPAAPKPRQGNSALATFGRAVTQGATFNLADEIVAGLDAVTQPLLGRGSDAATLGERYDRNLEVEREAFREDAAAHPVADIAGNVTGAVVGPGALVKAPKTVKGMIGQGMAAGAIYGFGQGEGGLTERAKSGAIGAGVGGLTSGVIGGAGKAYEKIRPKNLAANYVNKQFANSKVDPATGQTFAQESQRIGTEIGQTYTPGQATGSRSLLTIEGLIRRHPSSADRMANFDAKQLDVSLRNLNANLDRLAANPAGPEATGGLVSKAFDKVLGTARNVRRVTADTDFGLVDQIAGKARVVQPQNLRAAIDGIVDDFAAPGGGDASAALVNQIQNLKRALPEGGLTAKETGRLLEIYGKAASGTGAVFKDIDKGQQRLIARQLMRGLEADLDAAAENSVAGQVGQALRTARSNYRQNSKAINDLEKSVIGRLFGAEYEKAPERIAQAMRNMKPSELRQSMDILNKADPGTSQTVKRFLVEDAMAAAGVNPLSGAPQPQVAGEAIFSPAKFLTAIRKSPVWGTFEPTERKAMETAVRDLERVAFRAGTDGSPTAPLQQALSILSRPAGQTVAGGVVGGGAALLTGHDVREGAVAGATAGGLGGMAIPRLAAVITTPQGQQALRTLATAKPNSNTARAATAALVGLFAPTGDQAETEGASGVPK